MNNCHKRDRLYEKIQIVDIENGKILAKKCPIVKG